MTRAAVPSSPWEACHTCGNAPGLPMPDGQTLCPACAARATLKDAAQASLEALTAPVLGAWAAQWQAAGVPLSALEVLTESASGAWMHDRAARAYRLHTLRTLARLHAAPRDFQAPRPARVALAFDDLPMLEDVRPPDARQDFTWPHFVTGEGKPFNVHPGSDAVTVTMPDGVRAVLYVGMSGQVGARDAAGPGFRCPPHLWESVALALSGPDGLTMTAQGFTVEGDALLITCTIPGCEERRHGYQLTRATPYTTRPGEGEDVRVIFREADGLRVQAVRFPGHLWAALRPALDGGRA